MHKMIVLYPKPDDPEHFKKYYRETHIPLAKKDSRRKILFLWLSRHGRRQGPASLLHVHRRIRQSRGDAGRHGLAGGQGRCRRYPELFAEGRERRPYAIGMTDDGQPTADDIRPPSSVFCRQMQAEPPTRKDSPMNVAFLGLGVMGYPMAGTLRPRRP